MLRPTGALKCFPKRLGKRAIPLIRYNSTQEALASQVQSSLLQNSGLTIADCLRTCDTLEKSGYEAKDLREQVMSSKGVTDSEIHSYLVSPEPPVDSACQVITAMYKHKPYHCIPIPTLMIPFRRACYNAEFDDGFKLLDTIAGDKSGLRSKSNYELKRLIGCWSAGIGATLVGVDRLLASGLVGTWDSHTGVLTMTFTYLTVASAYGLMSISSMRSNVGDMLQWASGTNLLDRFRFDLRLKMATLLGEMNCELPENQGECSRHMKNELKKRGFDVNISNEEDALREYWARGGEGFVWAEPDQDPAEIIWRIKQEANRQKRIGSPYVRDDLSEIPPFEIPHATTTPVPRLKTPDDWDQLVADIKAEKLENERKKLSGGTEAPKQIE